MADTSVSIESVHQSPRSPLCKGQIIHAGGYEWVMPALNLRQLSDYQDALAAVDKADPKALFKVNVDAIRDALSRNYPAIALEHVIEIVDADNFQDVLQALQGASGLIAGEAAARSKSAS